MTLVRPPPRHNTTTQPTDLHPSCHSTIGAVIVPSQCRHSTINTALQCPRDTVHHSTPPKTLLRGRRRSKDEGSRNRMVRRSSRINSQSKANESAHSERRNKCTRTKKETAKNRINSRSTYETKPSKAHKTLTTWNTKKKRERLTNLTGDKEEAGGQRPRRKLSNRRRWPARSDNEFAPSIPLP
ncbi:uncharacterized protein G2W53_013723 [Senna tora]|uniref:Uncharacterized protein n=1 Tax=Senna tora TaxID=362788 RepID=A0A834TZE6_9FABA|nr:uncharacterized protein G2W53_013723 [Senna tora]